MKRGLFKRHPHKNSGGSFTIAEEQRQTAIREVYVVVSEIKEKKRKWSQRMAGFWPSRSNLQDSQP